MMPDQNGSMAPADALKRRVALVSPILVVGLGYVLARLTATILEYMVVGPDPHCMDCVERRTRVRSALVETFAIRSLDLRLAGSGALVQSGSSSLRLMLSWWKAA